MSRNISVIGVGNMAKAIIGGILGSDIALDKIFLFDKILESCSAFEHDDRFEVCDSIASAVQSADLVLLSVKPQNFPEVLEEIKNTPSFADKLYISIAAGISVKTVSDSLGGADVIRVLPNLPMTIGKGVSVICRNDAVRADDFELVRSVFEASGSVVVIDEVDMNKTIGVTSSSPAYVFKFIDAICKGAEAQGLDGASLVDTVCDMVIGSAMLLKSSSCTPAELITRVASKGGTTEQALIKLNEGDFDEIIKNAMIACTARADELGKQ